MPIVENLTDRQLRKIKFKVYIYTTLVLVLIFSLTAGISIFANNLREQEVKVEPLKVCIEIDVEKEIIDTITQYIQGKDYILSKDGTCDISVARNIQDANEYTRIYSKTYALVTSNTSSISEIQSDDITKILNTQIVNGKYQIYWDTQTDNYLRSRYTLAVGQTLRETNDISPKTNEIYIIPISQLNISHKVLSIYGQSPLTESFSPSSYPLLDSYWIKGEESSNLLTHLKSIYKDDFPDTQKLTTLILTGSSSIGGELINRKGGIVSVLNPISNILNRADIIQINNESVILNDCQQFKLSAKPCFTQQQLELFTKYNFKVVGVNGNHILDYGVPAYTNTLDQYKNLDIEYYGGGKNSIQANTPAQLTHNGNTLYFLGYNFVYPFSYYSTKNTPGSANVDINILKNSILKIPTTAVTIVDMGWGYEDKKEVVEYQKEYSQTAIQNGADIVIGTHSKLGQEIKIEGNTVQAYNLGSFLPSNLDYLKTKGSNIILVQIYENKIISSEIYPITLNNQREITVDFN